MGQSIDFILSNPSSSPADLELLSAISSNSTKSTKFRTVTPYTTSYPSGSTIIFRHSAGQAEYVLSQAATPAEILVYFNTLNLGEFSLYANNAIDGTVFQVISPYSFSELEINLSVTYFTITSEFNIGTGFNAFVRKITVQSDGKILVGGEFATYNGTSANRIIRLNSDGTVDSSFVYGTGFNGTAYSIAVQSDGKILVGGGFTSYNGTAANRIIRLNTDGTVDSSFVYGTGFNNVIYSISLQSDGKILVVGSFSSYNGTGANRIIRLNTNGSVDSSFVYGTGFNNVIYSITLQSDGKILAVGFFTSYNGTAANYIIRLNTNGTVDSSFVYGTGFSDIVYFITHQSDGKILVGGGFTSYNGTAANYIIRLNTDGTVDSSFVYGTGFNNYVQSMFVQSDGKILVGGGFTSYNGTAANYIIRLNTDGTVDSSFVYGTGFNSTVYSFSIQSDGKILIGGAFTSYDGSTDNYIIRLNSNGGNDSANGFNGFTYSIIIQSDGKILIGGNFTSYKGTSANRIIRLNSDGTVDSSFVYGTGFNAYGYSIALQSDGKILIGGNFTIYNGTTRNFITRLNSDGTIDSSFVYGSGFNSIVRKITIQSDGKILVGGDFTSYNGTAANRIIRLNSDGTIDSGFIYGTGFNNTVYSITVQSDGKILIGGLFTSYNGTAANYIIRLNSDGTVDSSFVYGTGFNGFTYSIIIQSDGKILIGGNFTSYKGTSANRIIRLNSDGTVDSSFVYGTGFNGIAYSIIIQSNGKILVGGAFTTYNGTAANFIIRINSDGSIDSSFVYGTGFNDIALGIILQSDEKILVGGNYTIYNGENANRIIRLNSDGTSNTI